MQLWIEWWNLVGQLRPAFSRTRTFIWFAVALAATCVRGDLLGVTSLVRTLGLQEHCYDRLLDCFHCAAAVWKHFGSWLRTIRPGILPSELVVAAALRHSLPLFLADSPEDHTLTKVIRQRLDLSRHEGAFLAAA